MSAGPQVDSGCRAQRGHRPEAAVRVLAARGSELALLHDLLDAEQRSEPQRIPAAHDAVQRELRRDAVQQLVLAVEGARGLTA